VANAVGTLDEEHPLQWLQPTPELSTCAAIYLPQLCRQPRFDGQAFTGVSQDSYSVLHEALSDASTSASEHGDLSGELSWVDMGMDYTSAREVVTLPPPLTPCVSSLPTPPPPPAHMPLEVPSSPLALQTPSPTCTYATSMSRQQFAARGPRASEHPAPTLLATLGSFAALSAWSATCDRSSRHGTEKPLMTGRAQASEPETMLGELVSAGSVLHELGTCKPCAFFHRPAGCTDGSACKFCHLCELGEKKRRQKQKFERIQQRRLRRAATSASSAEIMGERCSFVLSPGTPAPR